MFLCHQVSKQLHQVVFQVPVEFGLDVELVLKVNTGSVALNEIYQKHYFRKHRTYQVNKHGDYTFKRSCVSC